jgi:two-component system response regulator
MSFDGSEIVPVDGSTRAIPVIVLTSCKEEKDLVTSYNLGVNGYIQRLLGFEFRKMVHTMGLFWLLLNRLPSQQTPNASAEESG